MRKTNSYGTYRGRSGASKILKILIALLSGILILSIAVVLYMGQYQVFSADGPRIELPFLKKADPSEAIPSPALEPTPSLVVVTPAPTPPPQVHVATLSRLALYDGTVQGQIADTGANAIWFDMKADDGTLGYVSALPLAIEAKATSGIPALNDAILKLNGTEGLYTVARVSCFKDNLLSDADKNLNILTNSGYRWTDPQKLKWSSPTNEAVRAYVAGVCAELAALGFDEILLDNGGYPTNGNLGYIKKGAAYQIDQLDEVVSGFYGEVKAALDKYPDVILSIVSTEGALDGTVTNSGQTAHNVAAHAQRVWIAPSTKDSTNYVTLLSAAGMPNAKQADAIVLLASAPGNPEQSWAIWP